MDWTEATIIIFDLNWARRSDSDHWEVIHVLNLFAYHFVIIDQGLTSQQMFSAAFHYHEVRKSSAIAQGQQAQPGSPSLLLATLIHGVTDLFLEICLILYDHLQTNSETASIIIGGLFEFPRAGSSSRFDDIALAHLLL